MSAPTESQRQAIHARGNVLVVAGAGTGKTRTLVERTLRLLIEEGVSLENILMVTFTDAAAAEMRQRIRAALQKKLAEEPPGADLSQRLAEQFALLDSAHISTLHGFCLELVRRHFYELEIDPSVAVLDERQTQPLIHETLDALLQRHYAGTSEENRAVQSLIREQGRGADDKIRELVKKLHRYTQTLADPPGWLAEQESCFADAEPVRWRQWLVEGFAEWRDSWRPVLEEQPKENENARKCQEILGCTRSIGRGAAVPAIFAGVSPVIMSGKMITGETPGDTGGTPAPLGEALAQIAAADEIWPAKMKGKFRDPIEHFFEEAKFLQSLTEDKGAPLAEDWQWVRPQMRALLRLAREFTARFSDAKRELGGVDFADLEQFTLRLLRGHDGQPTATARHWQEQFAHVFVDEYQDINAAQDAILQGLSRTGVEANRFLVGDVKQSIYRFRLADPKIFRDYQELWKTDATAGTCVPLADNFRSREKILDFINPLIAALMRAPVGGVAYDAEAQLRFGDREGRPHLAADEAPRVELHLLSKTSAGGGEDDEKESADLDATETEARVVARRLRALHDEGHLIWDEVEKKSRPVAWRDMVVLLRSPAARVESFAQEFHRAGVPLQAARAGFYAALEVMDLLNLLRLLDNPLQDVPLLAVLRSPLVGLSIEELAQVRAGSREKYFWTALRQFQQRGANLDEVGRVTPCAPSGGSERANDGPSSSGAPGVTRPTPEKFSAFGKVDLFLTQFDRWRELVRQTSLSHCLETALRETHYEALLFAEERAAERAANVRRLLDLTRQYDPYQRQGLFRFLRFIDEQEDAELDLEPAPAQTAAAVRLMSIHKSKGLEFPVVVLAGLGTKFNERDTHDEILLDEVYGLCPKVTPPDADQRYPSLPYWLAKRRARRELRGEELRLLYVALTRARDTLILVGTASSKSAGEKWESTGPSPISDRAVESAHSHLDWLRRWLPQATTEADWRGDGAGQSALLRWEIYGEADGRLRDLDEAAEVFKAVAEEANGEAVAKIQAQLAWRYGHAAATSEPAKTSVSVLRRRHAEETDGEAVVWFKRGTRSAERGIGKLSAADIGTAHHLFLQLVALEKTGTLLDLQNEAARLERERFLTAEQAAVLDFDALGDFWSSEIGRKILAERGRVHRELPFTARLGAEDLAGLRLGFRDRDGGSSGAAAPAVSTGETPGDIGGTPAPLGDGEFIVVQGVADLAVILEKEIWLLDFKTDALTRKELPKKTRHYESQLKLYALALGRIYRRPVTRRWLHFLEVGETVAL